MRGVLLLTSIIAFNEARMLPQMLGHLPRGTEVLVIDGAYADFPHEKPWSTDGTLDIARRWGAKVKTVKKPWENQMVKRTAALVPGRVCFCPDADELLHTAMPELPDDADVGWVTCISPIYDRPFLIPRVFRVREGWHFAGRHHWLYDADGNLVTSHTHPGKGYKHAILPVCIANARDSREVHRESEKYAYLRRRRVREARYDDESCVYEGAAKGDR